MSRTDYAATCDDDSCDVANAGGMDNLTPTKGYNVAERTQTIGAETPGDRLARIRNMRGLSQEQLALEIGFGRNTIARWETSFRALRADKIELLSDFFQVPAPWLQYGSGDGPSTISVLGIVGAGQTVIPIDDTGEHDEIEAPFACAPDMAALLVKGDSMRPEVSDGDWVLYRANQQDPNMCLNRLTVVRISDGRVLVKRLRRGDTLGRFDLESTNAAPMFNQEVIWCARVEAVKFK